MSFWAVVGLDGETVARMSVMDNRERGFAVQHARFCNENGIRALDDRGFSTGPPLAWQAWQFRPGPGGGFPVCHLMIGPDNQVLWKRGKE